MKVRDLLAFPFFLIGVTFLFLTVAIGGVWTAEQIIENLREGLGRTK
jgi:hypothetical protein